MKERLRYAWLMVFSPNGHIRQHKLEEFEVKTNVTKDGFVLDEAWGFQRTVKLKRDITGNLKSREYDMYYFMMTEPQHEAK